MHLQLVLITWYSTHKSRILIILWFLASYNGYLQHSESLLKYTYSEVICLLSIWYHEGAFYRVTSYKYLKPRCQGKSAQLVQKTSRTGPTLAPYRPKTHKLVLAQYRPNVELVPVQYRPNFELVPVQYRTSTDPKYLSNPIPIQDRHNVEPVLAQRRTNKFNVGAAPVQHWPVKVNHLGTHYLYCI